MLVLAIALIALVLAALGVPVAFALFSGGIFYFLMAGGLPFSVYLQRVTSELDSFPLLAIPLFILAGNLMNHTGIAERIFNGALAVFGRVRGSLAHVNVASSMIFAGMWRGEALVRIFWRIAPPRPSSSVIVPPYSDAS